VTKTGEKKSGLEETERKSTGAKKKDHEERRGSSLYGGRKGVQKLSRKDEATGVAKPIKMKYGGNKEQRAGNFQEPRCTPNEGGVDGRTTPKTTNKKNKKIFQAAPKKNAKRTIITAQPGPQRKTLPVDN